MDNLDKVVIATLRADKKIDCHDSMKFLNDRDVYYIWKDTFMYKQMRLKASFRLLFRTIKKEIKRTLNDLKKGI